MIYDFQQPQKQSGLGIIIIFFEFVFKFFKAMWLPTIILLIRGTWSWIGISLLIVLGIFLIALLNAYLSYKYFSFHIDDQKQELIVQKGVINKELITIKLEKIQQVNLNQNFIQRILDLYAIQIDTAGGDANEVSLKALEEPIALALKAALLEKIEAPVTNEDSTIADTSSFKTDQTKPVLRLNAKTLFKIGISSNYGSTIAIFCGFLITMANQIREFKELLEADEDDIQTNFQEIFQFLSTGILFSLAFFILVGIHVFRTFYKFSNFEIALKNQTLHLSSGLFSKKSTHLRPRNVQVTSVSQNYFQRLLGFSQLQLKQATGLKRGNQEEQQQSNLDIPGANSAEKEEIINLVLGQQPTTSLTFKANYRYLFLPIVFYMIVPLVILVLWNYFKSSIGLYNWLSLPYILFTGLMIFRSYKNHQISLSDKFIVFQNGAWDVTQQILIPEKIQGMRSYQYLWHKSLNIGHLEIYTAGGNLQFMYGNYTDIQKLKNYWLYRVEQSAKDWN